jgi:hypothetical protein
MKHKRIIRKDEYVGVRMPRADKERLETAARHVKRDPSDLAWVLVSDGLDRMLGGQQHQPVTYGMQPR